MKKETVKSGPGKNLNYQAGQYRGLIIFILQDKEFCLDIVNVTAALKQDGSVNYLNRFISADERFSYNEMSFAAINLHKYFGLKLKGVHTSSRILLLEYNEFQLGFIVDELVEMLTIDNSLIEDFSPGAEDGSSFLKGILKFNGRKFLVPDMDKIVAGLK